MTTFEKFEETMNNLRDMGVEFAILQFPEEQANEIANQIDLHFHFNGVKMVGLPIEPDSRKDMKGVLTKGGLTVAIFGK